MKKPMNIQSLIFDKKKFTADQAKAWAKNNNFKTSGVDETGQSFRLRQAEPGRFKTMRTISLTDGVQAVVGKMSPTSSQIHVPTTGEEEKILIKTRDGSVVIIGKQLDFYDFLEKSELTAHGRQHVAGHNFAIPETRSYPIHDISPARAALSRVAQFGSDEEKAKVKTAVYRKYPSLRPVAKSAGPRRVATVAVRHGNHMLMGRRRDNGLWTTPGGHLDDGENFSQGALRELLEETGIQANAKDLHPLTEIKRVADKSGKPLHVQPFKVEFSERPKTSMVDDPDSEVHRWQWVDVSHGLPRDISGSLHTPLEKNVLMQACGFQKARASEADTSAEMYPPLNNLESEILMAAGFPVQKHIIHEGDKYVLYSKDGSKKLGTFPSRKQAEERERQIEYFKKEDIQEDSNNLDEMYGFQLLLEGMDWELEHSTTDPSIAKENAMEQLEIDPMHYRKLNYSDEGTDDTLAKGEAPWENDGLSLDLGSGQTREPGHIGVDLYPYDHGTFVHDLDLGLPFGDESASNIRLTNVDMEDPKPLLSEIQRVLMPGGQFTYEGPNDIYNDPDWVEDYPGMVLINHESNVDKSLVPEDQPVTAIHRQTFTRLAIPDPSTANDAEPRIGVAAYDMLPTDALLAMDALSYYNSDASTSGRGNRLHGYPSQGALFDGPEGDATKAADSSGSGDSNQKISFKRQMFVRNIDKDTLDDDTNPVEDQVHRALNPVNPNPAPPKRLRTVSKIEKALKKEKIVPILKMNQAKQIVYGVVLAPNEIDAQDDIMEPEDIEKAAHRYLANSRVVGSGHEKPIQAYPVESFIAPQDFEVHGQYGNQLVKAGSWVLGVKIEDPNEWQKVVDGDYQGFSVGGFGLRQVV